MFSTQYSDICGYFNACVSSHFIPVMLVSWPAVSFCRLFCVTLVYHWTRSSGSDCGKYQWAPLWQFLWFYHCSQVFGFSFLNVWLPNNSTKRDYILQEIRFRSRCQHLNVCENTWKYSACYQYQPVCSVSLACWVCTLVWSSKEDVSSLLLFVVLCAAGRLQRASI